MAKKYLDIITKNTQDRKEGFDFFDAATKAMRDKKLAMSVPWTAEGLGIDTSVEKEAPLTLEPWMTDEKVWNTKSASTTPKVKDSPVKKAGTESLGGDFTVGDWIGMASTVAGGISEVMNTMSAAKATKQPVNRFLGYNEKSLRVNKQAQMESQMNEQVAKRGIERDMKLKSNTLKSKLRGASSSISGLKAGDLAADYQTNEAEIRGKNEIENIYGNQMLQLLGRQEQLLSQQDQMEMSAQERVDVAEQQNLDNYYTNLATNIAGLSESGQKIGQDFNTKKYREDFLQILPMMNKWGVGIKYTDGVPEMYTTERSRAITEEGV